MLPMVELLEECRLAVNEVIEVLGRKTIEAILEVSEVSTRGDSRWPRTRACRNPA